MPEEFSERVLLDSLFNMCFLKSKEGLYFYAWLPIPSVEGALLQIWKAIPTYFIDLRGLYPSVVYISTICAAQGKCVLGALTYGHKIG